MKLNSHQLRQSRVGESQKKRQLISRHPIVLVLDNILDTYNIGSFFRLADAIAAQKLYLCGPVVTPPNIKIDRASVGTWKWVPWEQQLSTIDCLRQLKSQGYHLIACEQSKNSLSYLKAKYKFPLALVLGSETDGISSEALKLADQIIEIPLFGVNISLNVLVAGSIISYDVITHL
jgi:tRNA G18 (ribose-2'-O)-methylase SpoU